MLPFRLSPTQGSRCLVLSLCLLLVVGMASARSVPFHLIAGALAIGLTISTLELVCTGQVCLPTLTFIAGVPGMRLHAFSYLVLYNVMFVLPLLHYWWCPMYWGATSMQLGGVLQRHLVTVKLGTGMLLSGLGIWLLSRGI